MHNYRIKLILIILVSLLLTACDRRGDDTPPTYLVEDSMAFFPQGYYVQCTGLRCEFNLFEGEPIQMNVPTWHRYDTGVGLVGDSVIISAIDEYAGHPNVPVNCYVLNLMGYWEENVSLSIGVRVAYALWEPEDGEDTWEYPMANNVDFSTEELIYKEEIKDRNWVPFKTTFLSPSKWAMIYFDIIKEGEGEAILYKVEINGKYECIGENVVFD